MSRFFAFLNIILILFSLSCKKNETQNNTPAINLSIEGFYANDEFDILKITVIDNNSALLETFSIRGREPMEKSRDVSSENHFVSTEIFNNGYLLKGSFDKGNWENFCFIYKEGDTVFMEMGTVLAGEEVIVFNRPDYQKTELSFDRETYHRISDFIYAAMGLRYDSNNPHELWMVKPQYPDIFAAKITIDDDFKVVGVDEGKIFLENDKFKIQLASSEFYVNDARELFDSIYLIDLSFIAFTPDYDKQNFTFPKNGDYLYESLYLAESYEIEENGVNINYDLINEISQGMVIRFSSAIGAEDTRRWVFSKDKIPLSIMPMRTIREIFDFDVINDSEMHVKLKIDNEKENRHYAANFIFEKFPK